MNYINQFLFGIYPYIALAIFLLGSLILFDREQYTWRSESTQVLHTGRLRLGSILFHIGIIGLLGGHAVGLLTPVWVWDTLGVTHGAKQIFAMAAGGVMGTLCLAGIDDARRIASVAAHRIAQHVRGTGALEKDRVAR